MKSFVVVLVTAILILGLWGFIFNQTLGIVFDFEAAKEFMETSGALLGKIGLYIGGIIATLFIVACAEDIYYDW